VILGAPDYRPDSYGNTGAEHVFLPEPARVLALAGGSLLVALLARRRTVR